MSHSTQLQKLLDSIFKPTPKTGPFVSGDEVLYLYSTPCIIDWDYGDGYFLISQKANPDVCYSSVHVSQMTRVA
jgi:hypothetical protein